MSFIIGIVLGFIARMLYVRHIQPLYEDSIEDIDELWRDEIVDDILDDEFWGDADNIVNEILDDEFWRDTIVDDITDKEFGLGPTYGTTVDVDVNIEIALAEEERQGDDEFAEAEEEVRVFKHI